MHHVISSVAIASLLAMSTFSGLAAPLGGDPLAPYRWEARLLVVLAPDASDPQLLAQRRAFESMKEGADERDLALIEGIGDEPRAVALRLRLGLNDKQFHAVLIGKDGGDKLTSATPLGAEQLFPLIDAMPMRQQEMKP